MAATPATRKTVNSGRTGPAESTGTAIITTEPARPKSTSATVRVDKSFAPVFSISACQLSHGQVIADMPRRRRSRRAEMLTSEARRAKRAELLTSVILHPARGFQGGADAFELCFELV